MVAVERNQTKPAPAVQRNTANKRVPKNNVFIVYKMDVLKSIIPSSNTSAPATTGGRRRRGSKKSRGSKKARVSRKSRRNRRRHGGNHPKSM
jgi:hypothetical protein